VDLPNGPREARPDKRNPPPRLIKSICGAFKRFNGILQFDIEQSATQPMPVGALR
jgi:hypothetical protein